VLKLPDGALYNVNMYRDIDSKFNLTAQISVSFSWQYLLRSIFINFRLLCT
jgi:hypothetical protein